MECVMDYGDHGGMVRKVLLDANILINRTVLDWLYAFYRVGAPFEPYISVSTIDEAMRVLRILYRNGHDGRWLTQRQTVLMRRSLISIGELLPKGSARSSYGLGYMGSDPEDRYLHVVMMRHGLTCLLTDDRRMYGWLSAEQKAEIGYEVMDAGQFFQSLAREDAGLLDKVLDYQRKRYAIYDADGVMNMVRLLHHAHCSRFAYVVRGAMAPPDDGADVRPDMPVADTPSEIAHAA